MVKQFIGFHGSKSWSGDLEGQMKDRGKYPQPLIPSGISYRSLAQTNNAEKEIKLLDYERNKLQYGLDCNNNNNNKSNKHCLKQKPEKEEEKNPLPRSIKRSTSTRHPGTSCTLQYKCIHTRGTD